MLESLDIWKLLAGLGVFLFGMFLMEESIKGLAGRSFKRFIKNNTEGRFKSIFTGALATSILQSSSAIGLMVLAFVGAGIMAMDSAIGVIIGSNIGTTFTGWIVASVGFELNIESFSLPMIGIGGLMLIILGKSQKYSHISRLLVGFGFLFMGLDYMKSSVSEFTDNFDLAILPDYGIFVYALFGVLITAVMQSSSAVVALVLTALHSGLLSFESSASIVIGADVGTTVTILIGAIGATQLKKRVAFSHLVFNLATGVLGLALLYPLAYVSIQVVGEENEVLGLALFHTLFNVIGVIAFIPFIGWMSRLLIRMFPDKNKKLTKYIHKLTPDAGEVAIPSVKNEVLHFTRNVMKFNMSILDVDTKLVFTNKKEKENHDSFENRYEQLKLLQAEIFTFSARVLGEKLEEDDSLELNKLLHAARLSLHSAKSMKDVKHNFESFISDDSEFLYNQTLDFRQRLIELYLRIVTIFDTEDHQDIAGEMARLLKHINKDDQEFVKAVQIQAAEKSISDIHVSEMLMVNRVFIQSCRQLLSSIRETLLTSEELGMFESLIEDELLIR